MIIENFFLKKKLMTKVKSNIIYINVNAFSIPICFFFEKTLFLLLFTLDLASDAGNNNLLCGLYLDQHLKRISFAVTTKMLNRVHLKDKLKTIKNLTLLIKNYVFDPFFKFIFLFY